MRSSPGRHPVACPPPRHTPPPRRTRRPARRHPVACPSPRRSSPTSRLPPHRRGRTIRLADVRSRCHAALGEPYATIAAHKTASLTLQHRRSPSVSSVGEPSRSMSSHSRQHHTLARAPLNGQGHFGVHIRSGEGGPAVEGRAPGRGGRKKNRQLSQHSLFIIKN